MVKQNPELQTLLARDYQHGFVTEIPSETFPPGLDESVIRRLSAIKQEPDFIPRRPFKAYRHWLTLTPPQWSTVSYSPIDFQSIAYYSAPKSQQDRPKSLDEVDPALLKTYEKLAFPSTSGLF